MGKQEVGSSDRRRAPVARLAALAIVLALTALGLPGLDRVAGTQETSAPSLTTERAEYAPGELVSITGAGLTPGDYDLPVQGPDGSVLQVDTVTADGDGGLVQVVELGDAVGSYEVRAYPSPWSGDVAEATVASTTFSVVAPEVVETADAEEPPVGGTTTTTETTAVAETPTTVAEEPSTSTSTSTSTPTSHPEDEAEEDHEEADGTTTTSASTTVAASADVPLAAAPTNYVMGPPALTTDRDDYMPGQIVSVYGSGFQPGEYDMPVKRPDGSIVIYDPATHVATPTWESAVADSEGNFTYEYQLNGVVGLYEVRAYPSPWSGSWDQVPVASVTFTDAASANLDHCSNVAPVTDDCTASGDWVNQNLNGNSADYFEGDSVPYRILMGGITIGPTHTLIFEFDSLKDDKHALDYATTYNRTETLANPCAGVASCNLGTADTFPITDPTLPFTPDPVPPDTHVWTLFGGDITNVTGPTLGAGDDEPLRYTVTFTSTVADPVFAWGAHIARRVDWSPEEAAVDIDGAPYHTSLVSIDGGGGNQDRSLQGSAVTFPSTITIVKDAIPDDLQDFGYSTTGGLLPLTFSLDDDALAVGGDGTLPNSRLFDNIINFDTDVTVTEDDPSPGFSLSGLVCTEDGLLSEDNSETSLLTRTATIDLEEGEDVVCTFTNSQQPGSLGLSKTVVNNSGGTAGENEFVLLADGPGANDVTDAGGDVPAQATAPGVYTLSETGPVGYSDSGWSCSNGVTVDANDQITLPAGTSTVCSITNTDDPVSLALDKTVVNNSGGTATEESFVLLADGPGANDVTDAGGNVPATNVVAGTYTLSETGPAGYSGSLWTCSNGVTVTNGQITLGLGQSTTCSITNTDDPVSLALDKTVVNNSGGTATEESFVLLADGPGANDVTDAGGDVPATDVVAGTYTLSETGPAGYSGSLWTCSDGVVVTNNQITLGLGQSTVCSITNTDDPVSLALDKTVVNNSGGTATEQSFVLLADGPGANDVTDAGGDVPATNVVAGTYTLSETGPAGYSTTGWTCSDGVVVTNNQITLGLGQSTVCSITNTDDPVSLALDKTVVNNSGGTATEGSFVLLADGPGANDVTDAGGDVPATNVVAGTYTLSETGPAGYSTTGWTCSDGVVVTNNQITLALGQTAVCSITNTDDPVSLALDKTVVNNSGGTATEESFVLLADGPGANDVTDAGGDVPATDVVAGTYTLSETGPAGYSGSLWTCSDGVVVTNNQITLALGQAVVCSITNTDDPVSLELDKTVVNNSGGTATEQSFVLLADGPGANDVTDAGGDVPATDVVAGTYTLSETGPAGYSTTGWACTNGVTVDGNDQITLGLGQSTTCSITNTDDPVSLALDKTVVNNSGGTATEQSFVLLADGPGANDVTDAGGDVPATNVVAGTYTLSETGPAGYSTTGWTCSDGVTVDGNDQITLALGQAVVCSITNTDDPVSLELNKTVVNNSGGTATEQSFVLLADGPGANDVTDAGGDVPATNVVAGTYTLSETGPAGYSTTGWTCSDGVTVDGNDQITLALGQTVVCSITNTDDPVSLALDKTVVNNSGGTATEQSFVLLADGPGANDVTDAGGDVPATDVVAGTYTLSETGPADYSATGWACTNGVTVDGNDQITLGLGQSTTCSITNTDDPVTLALDKAVLNDNGGTATEESFVLLANGPGANDATDAGGDVPATDVVAGSYTLSETGPAGYSDSGWTCTNGVTVDGNDQITLALGQSTTCSITNTDDPISLSLDKVVMNNNGGGAADTDFTLTATGPTPNLSGPDGFDPTSVIAGVYTLSESGVTGYSQYGWSCTNGITVDANDQITLGLGESAVCTVTNGDDPPTLALDKVVINDDDGGADDSDFTLTATGPTPNLTGADGFAAVEVIQGTYTLSETGPDGYTASAWVCTGTGTQNGNQITLDLNESAVCTITNDDIAGSSLVVEKRDNGLAPTGQYDFRLTGGPDDVDITRTTREDDIPLNSGNLSFGDLPAGDYVLCELDVPLFTFSSLLSLPGATANLLTGDVCAPISLESGEDLVLRVNNLRFTGGGGVVIPTPTTVAPAPAPTTPPPTVRGTVITKPAPIPRTGADLARDVVLAFGLILVGLGLRQIRRKSLTDR